VRFFQRGIVVRILELIFLSIYVAIVTALGIVRRRSKGDEDYVVGARKIERFGSTMTIFATLVSESLIFFAVSLTALYGPFAGLAGIGGAALGMMVLSFIAPKAHAGGVENRYVCITEYCKQRWGNVIGRFAQVIFLMLMAWVVILQINLNGKIMMGISGWTPAQATALTVTVVLFYTVLGGFRAVVSTDIFQGIVVGMMVFLSLVISPRPTLAVFLDTRFLSLDVLMIFITSFALTITRPELWQRIYSAASGRKAAHSLRFAALLYSGLGCFVQYFALAIIQSSPSLTPEQAFAVGYRHILPSIFAALFPVILLAAMMSSLDSAAFLLSVDLASLRAKTKAKRIRWARVYLTVVLVGSGLISLTIFDSLAFAYKLNGIVALFAIPLLMSFLLKTSDKLLGVSIFSGLTMYMILLLSGRIDRNPVESTLAGLVTGVVFFLGYVIERYLIPSHHPDV